MKYLLAAGALVALFSASTLPASAVVCTIETSHGSVSNAPPICALAETKTKHPGWYRDGGYCNGAATTAEVTASSHCKPIFGP